MYRLIKFIMSLTLFTAMGSICAMDAVITAAPATTAAPIIKWPLFLYAEAFPAGIGKPHETQEWVDMQIRGAVTATKEMVDMLQLPEMELVKFDWAYALHMVEKELLRKPFDTYTIDDIKLIASWLTRLTAKNPGSFRTTGVKWPTRAFSEEEMARLNRVEDLLDTHTDEQIAQKVSADDVALYQGAYLYFTQPENIEESLCVFLGDAKKLIHWLQETSISPTERELRALDIASFIHQKAVEIHAFEEGSKRLGRMLMYIFLAQQGLEPITFYNSQLHGDKLIASITGDDKNAFKLYVREAYFASTRARKNPAYFRILKELLAQNIAGHAFHSAILNHPLQKSFEQSSGKSVASVNSCAHCGKNAHISAHMKLQRCSMCRAVYYCSTVCQKAHWPSHKAYCKSASKKK